jgi:hypothetical protein
MGLKGYRLWAMGQLDSNVQSPAVRVRRSLQRDVVPPGGRAPNPKNKTQKVF